MNEKLKRVKVKLAIEKRGDGNKYNISCAGDAYNLMGKELQESDREMFIVLCLSSKAEVINMSIASIGSLSAAPVHPREVYKTAILSNAASIICLHNHPSGDPTPSMADLSLTERLYEAGLILGIRLLDHIIVGDGTYISLSAADLMNYDNPPDRVDEDEVSLCVK